LSAEKEIVNYWYNRNGYFTVSNIKAGNKDAGIVALKPNGDAIHAQTMCSITGIDTKDLLKSSGKICEEKFYDSSIQKEVNKLSPEGLHMKKVLVLSSIPKSKLGEIKSEFLGSDVEIVEFESILFDVIEQMDTQYYKNDILRTLQFTKFLLLSNPERTARLLVNDVFTPNSRKEFLSKMLDNEGIIKEFRKTNSERLSAILRNSSLKADELAGVVGMEVLNSKTRKKFLDSMMKQEPAIKTANKTKRIRKKNMPLAKFMDLIN
jgi:hypothetical protein